MKKIILFLLFLLSLCLLLAGCSNNRDYSYKNYVIDEADLLTSEEEANLQKQCEDFADKHKAELVLLITENTNGKSSEVYADDYYDYHGYGYNEEMGDGVLLLIDLDNRMIWLSSSGSMLKYFNTYESCEAVTDCMISEVQQTDYAAAFSTGIKGLNAAIRFDKIKVVGLLVLLPSLLIASAVTAILYFCFKGSDHKTVTSATYRKGQPRILEHYDRFTHRTTKTRKIESDHSKGNSSAGGGGVHHSSSGNSHGGGGSRF